MLEKRLGTAPKFILVSLAFFADGCGLIPLLGPFLAIPFIGGIYYVFQANKVPMLGDKTTQWVKTCATLILEQLPLVSFLPVYTCFTLLTIHTVNKEDNELLRQYTKSMRWNQRPRMPRGTIPMVLFLLAVGVSLFVPTGQYRQFVYAQIDSFSPTVMTVSLTPSAPEPFDSVQVKISGYSVNLATSNITWKQDGKNIAQGVGLTETTVTVGGEGSNTILEVTVAPILGAPQTFQKVVYPSSVSLVWEAKSYVPPFYHGKALHGPGGAVTFIALPSLIDAGGSRVPSSDLIFTWRRNGQVIPQVSGVGKGTVTIQNDKYFSDLVVGVEVTTRDKTRVAQKTARIPVQKPELLLYQHDPLLGLLTTHPLVGTGYIRSSGAAVYAEPYYVSASTRDATELAYTWTIAGNDTLTGSVLDLQPEGVGSGTSLITASFRHLGVLVQTAGTQVNLRYDIRNTTSNTEAF